MAHAADAAAVRNARENFRAEPLIVSGQMNDWPMLESPLQSLHELAGAATVEALHLRYDLQGVQCGHSTHEMCLSELISRATASEGLTDCAWYLQWGAREILVGKTRSVGTRFQMAPEPSFSWNGASASTVPPNFDSRSAGAEKCQGKAGAAAHQGPAVKTYRTM